MSETETLDLLKRISDGDGFAFSELSSKYKTLTESASLRAAKSLEASDLSTADCIEDLQQEAQLALYRAALRYDREGMAGKVTFGLFAKVCVRNAMISQIRKAAAKRRRHEKAVSAAEELMAADGIDETAERVLSNMELERILEKSGSTLSDMECAVLMLYLQGKSNVEIAHQMGRSAKSVSNAIYRMKVKLKGLSE